jgi:hypothetical protein
MCNLTPVRSDVAGPMSISDSSRLQWLLAANALARHETELYRPGEKDEMLMMSRAVPVEEAFGLFGLLLGTLPPAAIFYKFFGHPIHNDFWGSGHWLLLLLGMNITCAFVGRKMGAALGKLVADSELYSWTYMLVAAGAVGVLWGMATGSAGGALFFLIGAPVGGICAAAVGFCTFPVFASIHRAVSRGGMIEARHLWPATVGIAAVMSSIILNL